MADFQPEHEPAVQDFLQWKDAPETYRRGCGGPQNEINPTYTYIPLAKLTEHLTVSKIRDILEALFGQWDRPAPDAERIQRHYLRSFAILLSAGGGRMIYHFVNYQALRDQYLPFYNEPKNFPKSATTKIFDTFQSKQWQFCAVNLEYDMTDDLGEDDILPILSKEEIGDGGSATTYKITVDKEYSSLSPAKHDDSASVQVNDSIYVLKTYRTPDAKRYFETECDAFRALRYNGLPDRNIIGYYGSFTRGESYNILLEHADKGTLEDYMRTTPPPTNPRDILTFWKQFLAVLGGLVHIHGTPESDSAEMKILRGWHQDINPTNILVVGKDQSALYDCDFKIADLGLAHIRRHLLSLQDPTTQEQYGTNIYGAPETHRSTDLEKRHLQARQRVDIWSMGCILSEVVTWVTEGWKKLTEYRRRRKAEIGKKSSHSEELFHWDYQILSTVNEIHEEITESSRKHDYVTTPVISRLIKGMLIIEWNLRGPAEFLHAQAKAILQEAQSKLDNRSSIVPRPYPSITSSESSIHEGRRRLPPNLPLDRRPQRTLPPEHQEYSPILPHTTVAHQPSEENQRESHVMPIQGLPSPNPRQLNVQDIHHESGATALNSEDSQLEGLRPLPNLGGNTSSYPRRSITQHQTTKLISTDAAVVERHPPRRSTGVANTTAGGGNEGTLLPFRPRNTENPPVSNSETSQDAHHENLDNIDLVGPHNGPVGVQNHASPRRARSKQQHPHPKMTVSQGLSVKRAKDNGSRARYHDEDGVMMLDSLRRRDHVFLIDNAESMGNYRKEVRDVLELLSAMVQGFDPDGLDIYFSTSSEKLKARTNQQALKFFDDHAPYGFPDFRERFSTIIERFQSQLGKRNMFSLMRHPNSTPKIGPRRLSLYVLTDGIWQPKTTLVREIKTLVARLLESKLPDKYIGIQFIRFGHDEGGKRRLQTLDAGLNKLGLELDIVDTTSAEGNVWKMLLGAVNYWFDDDDDDDDGDLNEENSETP